MVSWDQVEDYLLMDVLPSEKGSADEKSCDGISQSSDAEYLSGKAGAGNLCQQELE